MGADTGMGAGVRAPAMATAAVAQGKNSAALREDEERDRRLRKFGGDVVPYIALINQGEQLMVTASINLLTEAGVLGCSPRLTF